MSSTMTTHLAKGSCANLRNARTSANLKDVNCTRCILSLNKKVIATYIKDSSKYEHSNYVGVDLLRAIPKWVVMGFHSYTTPSSVIKQAFKLTNPKLMFERREFVQLVALRELNPHIDPTVSRRVLKAFKECAVFVFDQINGNTDLSIRFSFAYDRLQVDNPRTKATIGFIDVLKVITDLGYVPQYILSIVIGKMANIRLNRQDLPMWAVMEQIFSNQSNTSQKAYRTLVKAILSGEFYQIDDLASLFPQICGLHHEIVDSSVLPPEWISLNRKYIGELRIIEEGL